MRETADSKIQNKRLLVQSVIFCVFLISNFGLLSGCSKPPSDMAYIPKGEFIMGSDEVDKEAKAQQYGSKKPWYANERPKINVYVKKFYIDKYEVTIAQYKEFINATGRTAPEYWARARDIDKFANYPVTAVSWYEAKDYCEWRGKRLPTEAEWEKAARGTDGRRFPWGNEFNIDNCNCLAKNETPLEVGSIEGDKSPYGVYDMAGNVLEWTADWYKPYPGNDYNDKDYGEKFKVIRGGGWGVGHYVLQYHILSSHRTTDTPENKLDDTGFRCAKG